MERWRINSWERASCLIRAISSFHIYIFSMAESLCNINSRYILDNSFCFILSSEDSEVPHHTGVHFIISLLLNEYILSIHLLFNRLTYLKVKTKYNRISIFGSYTPHNGNNLTLRKDFFLAWATTYVHFAFMNPNSFTMLWMDHYIFAEQLIIILLDHT